MKNLWNAAMRYTPSDNFALAVHQLFEMLNWALKIAVVVVTLYFVITIGFGFIHHYHLLGFLWGE